jgi:hypothetical protein
MLISTVCRVRASRRVVMRRGGLALLSVTFLPARPAASAAAGAPPSLDLHYSVTVSGVQVAAVSLSLMPDGGSVKTSLEIRNQGIAAFLGGEILTRMTTTSAPGPHGMLPLVFDSLEQKPDRTRKIQIRYDASGDVAGLIYHNNGRLMDSEVPAKLQEGTLDPLTGFLRLRAWLPRAASGEGAKRITLPIFDGRKRLDLDATYLGRATHEGRSVRELKVQLMARYGFDSSDTFMTFPNEPNPRWIRVLVSDDTRLVPVYLETVNGTLASVVTLVAG